MQSWGTRGPRRHGIHMQPLFMGIPFIALVDMMDPTSKLIWMFSITSALFSRTILTPPVRAYSISYYPPPATFRNDLHEYNFDTSAWSAVQATGRRPRARYRATTVVHKNLMILFGGHDGTRHLNDTFTFDLENKVWSCLITDGIAPSPRDSHISVVHGNSMYIFGGSSGSAMNDLHELQLSTKESSLAKW